MQRSSELLIKNIQKDSHGRIQKVLIGINVITQVLGDVEFTKDQVIILLKDGAFIKTVYKDDNGILQVGAIVDYYYESYGNEYLKTYSNKTDKDNLDNLPTF